SRNAAIFRDALQESMDRHSILRTAFFWEGLEEPLQVVRQNAQLPVEELDWRLLGEQEQRASLESLVDSDLRRDFVLSEAPLMRLSLIRMEDEEYKFIWSHHHLLLDGWAFSLLLQDVFSLCDTAQ